MAAKQVGCTIEQYAGIRAALSEGHALEAVLAQEGLPAWRWPAIDLELSDLVTRDDGALAEYEQKLAAAEDQLDRSVEPLGGDLAAWTAFLAAMAKSPDLLERHGLKPTDMARLERKWRRRFEEDPELAKKAQKLAAEPPPPPASIEAAAPALVPFPWSPSPEAAAASTSLEPLAFLAETARKVAPNEGPVLPFAGSRQAPPARLEIEPNPMLGQTAVVPHRSPRAATPFEPPPAPEPAPSAPPAAPPVAPPPTRVPAAPPSRLAPLGRPPLEPTTSLAETAAAKPPSGPVLPFGGTRPPPAIGALEPVADFGMTAPVGARVDAPATPFAPKRSLEPDLGMATTRAGTRKRAALEPVAAMGATAAATPPSGPALPFAPPPPERWTPEDYGRFCAELDRSEASAVLARWGVADEAQRASLEQSWRERFTADPALRDRFVAALRSAVQSRAR
jgi:hypothetical protein